MKYEFDVYVKLIDIPVTSCREAVTENPDGSYTVFISSRQAPNIQLEAYEHALEHIRNNDFEKENVQQIEAIAHDIQPAAPAPVKKKRKKTSKYERFIKKLERRRKAAEELGLEEHIRIIDDEYGCPKAIRYYQ